MLKTFRILNKCRLKMAQDLSIAAFEQRNLLANEKLCLLQQQISKFHQDTIFKEEKRLQKENKRLLDKVSSLTEKLIKAEQANGQQKLAVEKVADKTSELKHPKKVQKSEKSTEKVKEKKQKEKTKEAKQPKQQKNQEPAPVDVSRLDMRVAKIMSVKYHPDADSLYVEEMETGEESMRTVVTGVVKHIPIEQMRDRMVVLMCNLKPAKMRGIVSQAMVMCANCPEKVEIIDPPEGSMPGDRIVFEGYSGSPDAQLNPKKKVWERIQPDLNTNEDCVACYKGVPFTVEGKGICKVQTLKNCGIK